MRDLQKTKELEALAPDKQKYSDIERLETGRLESHDQLF